MPRTKKLAHKRTGRQPANSTTSYRTFQTESANDRYDKYTSERTFCMEKGFLLQNTPTMGYEDFVYSVIAKHKWQNFCSHPPDAVVPIVREFYAHLGQEGQKTVYVRGIQVPIDDDTINQFYGLAGGEAAHAEYVANISAEKLQCALTNVCVADTEWTVSAQGKLTVPRANLTPQCKVWYHFLKTRLMPSTHIQTVSQGRILLLDSIISGRSIDVGAIIFHELGSCAAKKCGSLWFPSLITSLCVNHGVPIFAHEERLLSEKGAITKVSIARLLHNKIAGSVSNPVPNEEEEAGPVPPEPPKRSADASTSQGSVPENLAHSLKMLEQRMSQSEVQQFHMMEMMQQMHSHQQAFWTYTKQRDVALKKSLQKNFTKPIFPFPEFPDDVLARYADDDMADAVDHERDDDC